ncbi:hypothetical protein [Arthrobacter sp. Bz4]|uniref:hypothetical protein n=1 Tax=Arthrobacter sp. Bz4 TaxID=2171979 RepID=UPI001A9C9782|nr:hypothetical protein [Arthrobacter sp. Bz4]
MQDRQLERDLPQELVRARAAAVRGQALVPAPVQVRAAGQVLAPAVEPARWSE